MKTRPLVAFAPAVVILCVVSPALLLAAGQTSRTFRVVADVFTHSDAGLAVGASRCQASVSVGQRSVVGRQGSATFSIPEGYQATVEGFDTDYDGVPDSADTDDDEDGVPDAADGRPYDTDGDGMNNLADSDDDNEGLPDEEEQRFGTSRVDPNTDDDAHDDYQEWIAGTDGTDKDDFFHIADIVPGADVVKIEWVGAENRTYTVLVTNGLAAQSGWQVLVSTNASAAGRMAYDAPSPIGRGYYKITVTRSRHVRQ